MKRTGLAAVALLVIGTGLGVAAEAQQRIAVSIRPVLDIPLPPDPSLFRLGGGAAATVSYAFPFFRPLSMGMSANYHLGRMRHADLGNLGSLSVISAEGTAELRLGFLRLMEAFLSIGAGYFCAFQNDDPSSWASNLVFSGRIGIGLKATSALTIGIQGEYRRYQSLYHLIGAGFGVDFLLGGAK